MGVEKHYMRCRGEYFTCIDCGKSFAEDYAQHTSCVQEDDKYHGQWAKSRKGNKGQKMTMNGNGNKGGHTEPDAHSMNGKLSTNSLLSQNRATRRKRKTAEDKDDSNTYSSSSKKAKIDPTLKAPINGDSGSNSKKKKSKTREETERKRLRRILKNEKHAVLTLKDACCKFNESMGIEDPDD